MSVTTAGPTKSLRPDEQPMAHYRAVSRMAIFAAGLGLASGLVLASPLLAPIPIAAVVIALLALREIGRSEGQIVGKSVALAGLGLATILLSCSLARHFSRTMVLESEARRIADAYLDLLQRGLPQEALQFRQSSSMRIFDKQALAERFAKDPEAAKELQAFNALRVVQDMKQLGEGAEVRFERVTVSLQDGFTDRLVLKFSYERPGGKRERQFFWMHVVRQLDDSSKRPEWQVTGIDLTAPQNSE